MADVKCPLCGSMDVESEFIQSVYTAQYLPNAGKRIGRPFGLIGHIIGTIFGNVAKSLIDKDYYKCHCRKCNHSWEMQVGTATRFTLRDLFGRKVHFAG
jgi:hypothetical protein